MEQIFAKSRRGYFLRTVLVGKMKVKVHSENEAMV